MEANMYPPDLYIQNPFGAGTIGWKEFGEQPKLKASAFFLTMTFSKALWKNGFPVTIANMENVALGSYVNMPERMHAPFAKIRQRTISAIFSIAKRVLFTRTENGFESNPFIRTTKQVARSHKRPGPLFEFRSRCNLKY